MKKFYLLSVLLIAAFALRAQYVYSDFDNVQNVTFHGWPNDVNIVPNPNPSGINTSANVAKWVRGTEQYANAYAQLSAPVDLSTDTIFHMKVLSPIACKVVLKVQKGEDYTTAVQATDSIEVAGINKWVQLDFALPKVAKSVYDKIVLFFDFATTTDNTYYFDSLTGPAPMSQGKPLSDADVQDNFENDGTSTINDWQFQDPEFVPLPIVADPVDNSNHVANYHRSGNFEWTNAQAVLDHRLDLSKRNVFKMRVYFPSSNDYTGKLTPTVSVKLQNNLLGADGWKTQAEVKDTVKTFDKWQTFEFNFSKVADSVLYDKIVVQLGGEGHKVPGQFYFDDFMLEKNATGIRNNISVQMKISPNPVYNELQISGIKNIKQIDIYSVTGEKVFSSQQTGHTLNVSSLPAGIYLIRVKNQIGKFFTSKLLKKK